MVTPALVSSQSRNSVTLAKPAGAPDSQPREETNEVMPTSVGRPSASVMTRGPPESPLQVESAPPLESTHKVSDLRGP
jgi:hypothetical protein